MWTDFMQDARDALRGWRQRPALTAVAIVTLALGIGANTAIFTAVDAFFLRPLPYPDAAHLVTISGTSARFPSFRSVESGPDIQCWRDHATTLANITAMSGGQTTLTGFGDPTPLRFAAATPSFFDVVGVHPTIGRAFTIEEAQADAHVVVISHDVWVSRLGARPDTVGQTLRLNGVDWRVIGVMPASFSLPVGAVLWMPFDLARASSNTYFLTTLARLRPEATVASAQHDFDRMAAELSAASPKTRKDRGFGVTSLRDDLAWNVSDGLKLLQGVVALVLLIACANVANLLLAQAAARQREFGMRAALGATPARLVRQVLTESVMLAMTAAAVGVVLAVWGVRVLVGLAPDTLFRPSIEIGVNWPVLGFTLVTSIVTGVAFGLAPALMSARPAATEHLRDGVRTTSVGLSWTRRQRLRAGLVVAETALATVLLAGGGLLVRSFAQLMSQAPTIRTDHLMTAIVSLPQARYRSTATRLAFWSDLVERLRAIPGADGAIVSNGLPFSNWEWQSSIHVRGRPEIAGSAAIRQVSGGDYFSTLGIPLVRGRTFGEVDVPGAPPVMVVSDVFAAQFLAGADPLGQSVRLDRSDTWQTVVGVVAATRNTGLDEDLRAEMYVPIAQSTEPPPTLVLAVRTAADPTSVARGIRDAVASVDHDLPEQSLRTMDQLIGRTVADRRFFMTLVAAFAALAAMLAALGVYGVMSFLVGQGRREIGIRLALGARAGQVQRGLVSRALRIVVAGLALGLLAAWWLTSLLSTQLFHVTAHDPATLLGVAALLGGAATLASWIPSRRSTRVDPVIVLRAE
jgi:putative ABC transport system permease protein